MAVLNGFLCLAALLTTAKAAVTTCASSDVYSAARCEAEAKAAGVAYKGTTAVGVFAPRCYNYDGQNAAGHGYWFNTNADAKLNPEWAAEFHAVCKTTAGCGSSDVDSAARCEAEAKAAGVTYKGTTAVGVFAPRCYNYDGQNAAGHGYWFNTNADAKLNPEWEAEFHAVCKTAAVIPTPSDTDADAAAAAAASAAAAAAAAALTACPVSDIGDENECKNTGWAQESMGAKRLPYGGKVERDDRPAGCYQHDSSLYFNSKADAKPDPALFTTGGHKNICKNERLCTAQPDGSDIKTKEECEEAAKKLKLPYRGTDKQRLFAPACYYYNGWNTAGHGVWFNLDPTATLNPPWIGTFHGICHPPREYCAASDVRSEMECRAEAQASNETFKGAVSDAAQAKACFLFDAGLSQEEKRGYWWNRDAGASSTAPQFKGVCRTTTGSQLLAEAAAKLKRESSSGEERLFVTGRSSEGNMGVAAFAEGPVHLPAAIEKRLYADQLHPRKVIGRGRTSMLLMDTCGGNVTREASIGHGAKYVIGWGANNDRQIDSDGGLGRKHPLPTIVDFSALLADDEYIVDGSTGGYMRMGLINSINMAHAGDGQCMFSTFLITSHGRAISFGCNDFGQLGHHFNASTSQPFPAYEGALQPKYFYAGDHEVASESLKIEKAGLGWQGIHPWIQDWKPKFVHVAGLRAGEKISQTSIGRNTAILLTTSGRVFTAGRLDMVGRLTRTNEFREVKPGMLPPTVKPAPPAFWTGRFVDLQIVDDFVDGTAMKISDFRVWDDRGRPLPVSGGLFFTQACNFGLRSEALVVSSNNGWVWCADADIKVENPRHQGLVSFLLDLGQERRISRIGINCKNSRTGCKEHFLLDVLSATDEASNVPFARYGYMSANLTGVGRTSWTPSSVAKASQALWPGELKHADPQPEQFKLGVGEKVVRVTAGQGHNAMLTSKGRVFTFGNSPGALGRAGHPFVPALVDAKLPGDEMIVDIDNGYMYSLMRTSKQRVFSFGRAIFAPAAMRDRQLPAEVPVSTTHGIDVAGGEQIREISAGFTNAYLRTSKARAFSVGSNRRQQLLRMGQPGVFAPMQVSGKNVRSIAGGQEFVTLILDDGTFVARGYVGDGQKGKESQYVRFTDISTTSFVAAHNPGAKIEQMSMSLGHAVALATDGIVYSAGSNTYGQLGRDQGVVAADVTPKPMVLPSMSRGERVVRISAAQFSTYVLTSKPRLLLSGWPKGIRVGDDNCLMEQNCTNWVGVTLPSFKPGEAIVDLQAGADFAHFLTNHGRVFGVGMNRAGVLGPSCGKLIPHSLYGDAYLDPAEGCWEVQALQVPDLRGGETIAQIQVLGWGGVMMRSSAGRLFEVGDLGWARSEDYAAMARAKLVNGSNTLEFLPGEKVEKLLGGQGSMAMLLTSDREQQYIHMYGFVSPAMITLGYAFRQPSPAWGFGATVRHKLEAFVGTGGVTFFQPGERIVDGMGGFCALTSFMKILCWGDDRFGGTGQGGPPKAEGQVDLLEFDDTFMPTHFSRGMHGYGTMYLALHGHKRPSLTTPETASIHSIEPDATELLVEINERFDVGGPPDPNANSTGTLVPHVAARCMFGVSEPYQVVKARGYFVTPQRKGLVVCPRPLVLSPGIEYVRIAVDPSGGNFATFDSRHSKPMQTAGRKSFVVPFCKQRHDGDGGQRQGAPFCALCARGFVGKLTVGGYNNFCS
eukprot:g5518.t1